MTVTDIVLNGQRVGVGGGGGASFTAGDGLSIIDGVASIDSPVQGVLTEEEFNALPEDKQKKGLYVISDGVGSGGASGGDYENIYSTEETRIGTWVYPDGSKRPLYRRFVEFRAPTTSTPTGIFDDPDIDLCCKLDCSLWYAAGNSIEYYDGANYIIPNKNITDGHFYVTIRVTVSSLQSSYGRLIIEYTKTTDEPEVST